MTTRGLTWDHPRGYDALAEAARRANAERETPLIRWDKQPLEGFESAPIANLCAANDLVVMDHPHIGEAIAERCLTPLEDLYPAETLAAWETGAVGPAMSSYRWAEKTWALPLDVACQVTARRPDLVDAPRTWDDVDAASRRGGVGLSLAGPHAILTLMSMAAGQGTPAGGANFLPDSAFAEAFDRMAALDARAPDGTEGMNPIALLHAMATGEGIVLIPLVFGYVTYAREDGPGARLAFTDPPMARAGHGGVLGGTGIAFSARSAPSTEVLNHVASLMAPATQTGLFADYGGQPSARAAWTDAAVNAAAGGFYVGTLASAERAYLRPRFDGYVAFQTAAAARLRRALAEGETAAATLTALRADWRAARAAARGPLDTGDQT